LVVQSAKERNILKGRKRVKKDAAHDREIELFCVCVCERERERERERQRERDCVKQKPRENIERDIQTGSDRKKKSV